MTAFLVYLIQLWTLIALVIAIHHTRNQIGLMPLLFMATALMAFLNFSPFINVRFEVMPGVRLGIAGHVIVPIILSSLIIVYLTDGDEIAQLELAGLIGVNTLILLMLGFVVIYLHLEIEDVIPPASGGLPIDLTFLQRRVASAIGFAGAMLVVTISFQFLLNLWQGTPIWLAIGLALILALWTDSLLFFTISGIGLDTYFNDLRNDLLGKSIASSSVVIPLSWYLSQVVMKAPGYNRNKRRPTFAILFGVIGRLNSALSSLQSEFNVNRRVYEELTEHIGEIFWLADAQTLKIIYSSPAFDQITGYASNKNFEQLQVRLSSLIHPEDPLYNKPGLIEKFRDTEITEFRIMRADGQVRWLRNRTFPINDDSGKVYRIGGVVQDFTDRKLARERDFELAVAKERMQILHDFIRDASHDLKSPLSAILLKLDILERYSEPEQRHKVSEELRERVRNLSALIDDLFMLSRIEGHNDNPEVSVDIVRITDEVVREFLPLAQAKGLSMVFNQEKAACIVAGNEEQLRRAISNLISNAIRYTQTGSIAIITAVEGSRLEVMVKDTGIGISDNEISRVFDRFYRAQNARKLTDAGTGLGLAIVKAIIDHHNGEISVESEPGKGSTFTLRLPCVQLEAEAPAIPTG